MAAGKKKMEKTEEQNRLLLHVETTKTWIDDMKESLEKVKYNWSK